MNFIDAVKSVFTNYANFNGRARLSEYWWFVLFTLIVRLSIALMFNNSMLDLLVGLVLLIPGLSVAVRRVHDVGKSGWFILIPFYNLYLVLSRGERGTNQYGSDPLSHELEEDIDAIGNN